jgi:LPXTG-site transpeptidase (sortase) family protein
MVFFILGVSWLYGPALMAESRYQLLSALDRRGIADVRSLLVPKISLTVRPDEKTNEFGIDIPRLFLREKVIAEVDPYNEAEYMPVLKQGIAHAAGTGLPGQNRLGYYFAHSSNSSLGVSRLNAVFYTLHKLEMGDSIYLWHEGERLGYRVVDKRVTEAEDISLLTDDSSGERIALQTCWPPGTSLKRLIVVAERVGGLSAK